MILQKIILVEYETEWQQKSPQITLRELQKNCFHEGIPILYTLTKHSICNPTFTRKYTLFTRSHQ